MHDCFTPLLESEVKPKKKGAAHKVFRVDVSIVPDPEIFTKGRVCTANLS